jgi:hypothetical protein
VSHWRPAYSLLFWGASQWQISRQTATTKGKELVSFRYVFRTEGSDAHFHFKNGSFFVETFRYWLYWILSSGRKTQQFYPFLFKHFQSSSGSLPSPLNHLTSNCITVPICELSHPQELGGSMRSSGSLWIPTLYLS